MRADLPGFCMRGFGGFQASLEDPTVLAAEKMPGAVESSGLGVRPLCTVVFALSLRCHEGVGGSGNILPWASVSRLEWGEH